MSSDLLPGTLLAGRYYLGAVIGRGRLATVYRARDAVEGRLVAVKMFVGVAEAVETLERQTSKVRIGAQVNHPGLVSVWDVRLGEPRSYVVIELVEGRALSDVLALGSLRPEKVADVGAQLCAALAAVHDADVVHRGIEPTNVLIARGAEPTVKLTDFGLSRFAMFDRLTSISQPIGAPYYRSPEEIARRRVGQPGDVYAAGLVLLECLTGEVAFPGGQAETLAARLNGDPEIPASVGPEWNQILRAMTAHEPQDRPGAAEMSEALTALTALSSSHRLAVAPTSHQQADGGPTLAAAAAPKARSTAGVNPCAIVPRRDRDAAWFLRRKPAFAACLVLLAGVLVLGSLLVLPPDSSGRPSQVSDLVDMPGSGQLQGDRGEVHTEVSGEPSNVGPPIEPRLDAPTGATRHEPPTEPSDETTTEPSDEPTTEPTDPPTGEPTDPPTGEPTDPPTDEPTDPPTDPPTTEPTDPPTDPPTTEPTDPPTGLPIGSQG